VNHPEPSPPDPNGTRFDLKSEFYRTPQFIAAALCQWYEIDAVTTDDQITKLAQRGYISAENQRRFKKAMEMPLLLRVKTHSKAGAEWEGVRAKDHKYLLKPPPDLSKVTEKYKKDSQEHVEKFNEKLDIIMKKDIELTPAELTQLRDHAKEVNELWKLAQLFHRVHKRGSPEPRRNPFMFGPCF